MRMLAFCSLGDPEEGRWMHKLCRQTDGWCMHETPALTEQTFSWGQLWIAPPCIQTTGTSQPAGVSLMLWQLCLSLMVVKAHEGAENQTERGASVTLPWLSHPLSVCILPTDLREAMRFLRCGTGGAWSELFRHKIHEIWACIVLVESGEGGGGARRRHTPAPHQTNGTDTPGRRRSAAHGCFIF